MGKLVKCTALFPIQYPASWAFVKLTGVHEEDGAPALKKMAAFPGSMVKTIISQFAFTLPAALGLDMAKKTVWQIKELLREAFDRGSGLHGKVFSVANKESSFVKTFEDRAEFESELSALTTLKEPNRASLPAVQQVVLSQIKPTEAWVFDNGELAPFA